MRNRTRKANRNGKSRSMSGPKKLCVNPDCQRGVPLDQVQNMIEVFKGKIDIGLLKLARVRDDCELLVCCTCGNLSQGKINPEGEPIPITHLRLFRDPYSQNKQTVVYVPGPGDEGL